MGNIEFSILQEKDIKASVDIINKAYRQKAKGKAWTTEAHLLSGIRVNEEMLKASLKDENIRIYIAKLNNKLLAIIQAKLEDEDIHLGLFAVDPEFQASGIGKQLLNFAENSAKKLWNKNSFIMEVISSRKELKEYYLRRGYTDTNTFIDFPKSKYWTQNTQEELKLLILRKS